MNKFKLLNFKLDRPGMNCILHHNNVIRSRMAPPGGNQKGEDMQRPVCEDSAHFRKTLVAVAAVTAACFALAGTSAAQDAADKLVDYEIVDFSIPEPLTDQPGDPQRGVEVAVDRRLGNCLACHEMPVDAPFQGTVGPPLHEVASYMDTAQLRLRIVDSKVIYEDTIMPAFYKVDGLHRVVEAQKGKPMLTAQQVEDVVAYLATLKGQ